MGLVYIQLNKIFKNQDKSYKLKSTMDRFKDLKKYIKLSLNVWYIQ